MVIWSSRCFIKGNLEINAESVVNQSLNLLLKKFCEIHHKENTTAPVFKIYTGG